MYFWIISEEPSELATYAHCTYYTVKKKKEKKETFFNSSWKKQKAIPQRHKLIIYV